MGIDPSHMPFERLSQAIPPSYAQLVFSQACMERCRSEYGVPVFSFDQMLASPDRIRRTLAFWLRGAGGLSPGMWAWSWLALPCPGPPRHLYLYRWWR